jgi:polysaccharide biosynthesis transport protein
MRAMITEPQLSPVPHHALDALHRRQRARHLPDLTLSDALDAITSHWWIIACAAVLFAIIGLAGTLIFSAGYKTTGFLVVDARRSSAPEIGIITVQPGDPRVPRSEAKVLTAMEFLTGLVDRLQLDHVAFITKSTKVDEHEQGLAHSGDPAQRLAAARRDAAIDWLSRKLDVRGDDRSYAIEVSIATPDPVLSAKIVNGAMALYLERRNRDDAALVEDANKAVAERYNQILAETRNLEAELIEAHDAKGLVGTKAGRIDALDLTKLVDEQRENEKQIASLYDSLVHAQHADDEKNWQEIDSSLASPYLLKLLEQETLVARARADAAAMFGTHHPDMIKLNDELRAVHQRIHTEVSRIALTLSTQIDALKTRQVTLKSEIQQRTRNAAQTEAADEHVRQLEEELKAKQLLLSAYETRRQQLASSVGAEAGAVRIGAWAMVPLKPAGPQPALLVVLAGLAGGLIGGACMVLQRRFGDRMESADDIVSVIGLPVLGAIPEIKRRRKAITPRRIWGLCLSDPHGMLAESIRAIYMRVQFALDGGNGTVLLTSAHPSEGKTGLALSLSRVAALSGKRVLLIDGDFFRAGVSRAAGIPPESRRADGVLSITKDARSGVDILPAPCGFLPQDQSVLLGRLCGLIAEIRKSYDLVLIDTPPIMHVSDATLLAPQADAVLFVASLKHVHRSTLIEALERIEAAGRPILGIALSRVKPRADRHRLYDGRDYVGPTLDRERFAPVGIPVSRPARPEAHDFSST